MQQPTPTPKPTHRIAATPRPDRPQYAKQKAQGKAPSSLKKGPPGKPGRPPQQYTQKPGGKAPAGGRPQGMGRPPARKPQQDGGVTDWNGVANWYDELVGDNGSEFHREVVVPGTLRLLGANKGEQVLDVACGQGVLARALAGNGIEVTGVDAAAELIRAAKDRQLQAPDDHASAQFHVGDARDLAFLSAGTFAGAACVLAIQNIHPLGGLLAGVSRALRQGGRFVLVMMHPCFRVPKSTGWGWDNKAGVQFRRVDHYLLPRKVPIVTHPGSDPGTYTWSFHKPIGAYVKGLRNAGLLVDAIEEWPSHKKSTSGPRAVAENTAREEIPMFMAIRAIKVGEAGAAEE